MLLGLKLQGILFSHVTNKDCSAMLFSAPHKAPVKKLAKSAFPNDIMLHMGIKPSTLQLLTQCLDEWNSTPKCLYLNYGEIFVLKRLILIEYPNYTV